MGEGPQIVWPPRLPLGVGPTPLQPVPALATALGLGHVFVKRDDLIGFGFGGNKVRGLEFLLADAQAKDATALVSGAGVLSNHVRATAAAASHAGLAMHAVYWGDPPTTPTGNYLLSLMLGATPHFTKTRDRQSVDTGIADVTAQLLAAGQRPYAIPRGGATALGVVGHVRAAIETHEQARAAGHRVDRVIMAVGSGGMLAGWLLAKALFGHTWQVEGYTVSRPEAEATVRIAQLAREAAACLGTSPELDVPPVIVHGGVIGDGYGVPTPEGQAAIARIARATGLFFDPTYTGKTLAGLFRDAPHWPDRARTGLLFVHSGGEPALFAGTPGLWG